MARARNIKPGFFKNYELADLGPIAQVLFAGLWCLADKEGRLEDKPRLIKAEIFPYYDCDINGELTKLERLGFVERYIEGGISVISVCNFKKHQTPHNTEKASALPARSSGNPRQPTVSEDNGEVTVDSRKSNGGKTPDSLIPDSLIPLTLIPDSPIPEKTHVEQKPLDRPVEQVFAYWQQAMDSPKSALDDARKRIIAKALKAYSVHDLCKAISGCRKSDWHQGKNDRGRKFNGLDLILRNAEMIDKFIAMDSGAGRPGNESVEERNARLAAEFLGNVDDGRTIEMAA